MLQFAEEYYQSTTGMRERERERKEREREREERERDRSEREKIEDRRMIM